MSKSIDTKQNKNLLRKHTIVQDKIENNQTLSDHQTNRQQKILQHGRPTWKTVSKNSLIILISGFFEKKNQAKEKF